MSDFYMSDLDEDDIDFTDEQMFLELYRRVEELEKNLEIGLGCDKPDPPEVCNRMIGGKRKRKSRKKRGKGAMMSRKKTRQPKQKYLDKARQILENDPTYLNADIVERGRRERLLALELQDNDKKGGRRKRKSRRKTKKRRRSKRRKLRRRRR